MTDRPFPRTTVTRSAARSPARTRKLALRLGVVGVQVLIMLAIVLRDSTDLMMMLILAIVGVAGFLTLLRWPLLGLVGIAFVGLVLPGLGFGSLNPTILLMGGMLIVWIVDMVVVRQKLYIARSSAIPPLLIMFGLLAISFAMGQLPWFNDMPGAPLDAQLAGMAVFAFSIGVTVMTASYVRDIRWLEAITWAFLAFGALFVLTRLTPPSWRLSQKIFQGQATGGIFWAWVPALALGQALFNRRLHPALRAFLLFITAGTLYTVFVQNFGWKSGWVTVSVVIGTLVFLYNWRLGVLVGLAGAVGVFLILPDFLVTEDYSIGTRFEAWFILADMMRSSPFFGLGFGNYYWYTSLYNIRGFYVSFNSHNNFVDIIAQMGLVGFAVLVWFFVRIALLGWELRNRVPEGFARGYVYSCLGGTAGSIMVATLGDWLLPFVYNIGLSGVRTSAVAWLFWGGLIALQQMYPKQT